MPVDRTRFIYKRSTADTRGETSSGNTERKANTWVRPTAGPGPTSIGKGLHAIQSSLVLLF